jgi:HSP20 family protein
MATLRVYGPANDDAMTLRDAMDRLFEESFVPMPRGDGRGAAFVPAADAWETEDTVHIELALPGVDPESVDVTYEKDTLTISGQFQAREEDRNWVIRERPRGGFRRRFNLYVPVKAGEADASYRNGILTVELPKSEEVKPRKITVRAGE